MYITDPAAGYSDRWLELMNLIECGAPLWLPNPENAPQVMGYLSDAKIVGYGGGAGGGKTDLMVGKALNQHQKSLILREESTQMSSIVDRLAEILGGRDGLNGQAGIWRLPKRGQQIEFGSLKDPGDETKYQGRPHDFMGVDEATGVRIYQIRFLLAWLRSATKGQTCQAMLTFNPPTKAEGRWVLEFFRSWLETHTAKPGELRHYVTIGQKDIEVPNLPCVIESGEPVFDFEEWMYKPTEIIQPMSRTFIPARVGDNNYLGADYMAVLQSMPEPLRSQMLNGDFTAGLEDDEWQIIPTKWVEIAAERWERKLVKPPMECLGVDVARGGNDNTILTPRHAGMWFDEQTTYKGTQTPDGPMAAALVMKDLRDQSPVAIDVVGVGGSAYDFLNSMHVQTVGVNGGMVSTEVAKGNNMQFSNIKTQLWWRAREAFDPANNTGIAIPNEPRLKKDLTSVIWKPDGAKIRAESRNDIIKRIGRSPDWGSSFVLALLKIPKIGRLVAAPSNSSKSYNPFTCVGG